MQTFHVLSENEYSADKKKSLCWILLGPVKWIYDIKKELEHKTLKGNLQTALVQ